MKYILWNSNRDGDRPTTDEDGAIISDGVLGRLTADNVYLKVYAQYPEGQPLIEDIAVGEAVRGVRFHLSGETGFYDVWRVE